MMKGGDVNRHIFAAIIICDQTFIPRAGKVDDLQRDLARTVTL
jgi:hypothetical protein